MLRLKACSHSHLSHLSPPSHSVTRFVQSNLSVTQVTNSLFTLRLLSGMAFTRPVALELEGFCVMNESFGLKPLMTSLRLSLYSKFLRPASFSPFPSFQFTCPIPLPIASQIPTHCHWSVVPDSTLLCQKGGAPPCCLHSPLSHTASSFNRQLYFHSLLKPCSPVSSS